MGTKLVLSSRRHGVHTQVKEIVVDAPLEALVKRNMGVKKDEDRVDEKRLLTLIPKGWLPSMPGQILLIVGNMAVARPVKFRQFGKYFDAYSLSLEEAP
jgi:hypothetical protein